jgi:hypothetical protein
MFILGVILIIVGFLVGSAVLWIIGIVLACFGAIFWLLGSLDHAVAGRRHYW